MNPKNLLIALLVLTTAGGAYLGWRQYQELVILRAATLNAGERSDLQKKIWDLQKANQDLEEQLAALRASGADDAEEAMAVATNRGTPADENPRGQRGPRGRGQNFAAMQQLLAKPEVQALINSAEKSMIDGRYAALFKTLNLSPEQAEKLKALLIDRENARQDVFAAAREQGIDPRNDPDAFRKLMTDARNSVNESIKSLIGDNGFAQLSNYDQTMPQRNLVNTLQQRLATDAPLSSSQADQLVQILAANAPANANQNGGRGNGFGGFGGGGDFGGRLGGAMGGGGVAAVAGPGAAPITPAAVAQASTVLSQNQLTALQQLQQQQQTAQQLQQLIRSTWQQNNAANGGNGAVGQPGAGTGATPGSGGTGGRRRNGGG